MRRSLGKSLQSGVSLFALAGMAWAGSAGAQQAPADSAGVEEIVVTAQLREQKLQDVPISISAFNSDFINETGAQNVSDLQKYTPGLRVDSTSTTQPVFEIRGISTNDFGVGTDSVGRHLHRRRLFRAVGRSADLLRRYRAGRGAEGTAGHPVRPQHRGRRDLDRDQQADRPVRRPGRFQDRQLQ
ncbi:MAG: TonB-dependent receptor plug domain-containing protein [Aliidongia sp.]